MTALQPASPFPSNSTALPDLHINGSVAPSPLKVLVVCSAGNGDGQSSLLRRSLLEHGTHPSDILEAVVTHNPYHLDPVGFQS